MYTKCNKGVLRVGDSTINMHGRLTDPVTGRDAVDIDVITDVLCQMLNDLPENKDMLTSYSIAENAETGLYEKSIKID